MVDLCSEYCEKDKWCLLKEILVSLHPDPRLLVQLKCVEKFKYEISKEENKEIGWSEALAKWIDEGYAEKFSGIYEEDKNFRAIYNEVMKEES